MRFFVSQCTSTSTVFERKKITLLLYFLQGSPVEKQLIFQPPIKAFDQDLGINASLTFKIISGK